MTHGTVIADGHTATLLDDEALMTHARPWSSTPCTVANAPVHGVSHGWHVSDVPLFSPL